jgi:lysophospholipase L1-like esterase
MAAWCVGWMSALAGVGRPSADAGSTWRQSLPVAIGGRRIRLRFSNPSDRAIHLESVTVALENGSFAAAAPPLAATFDGARSLELRAGESVRTDPVPLPVTARDRVLVSTWSAEELPLLWHPDARKLAVVAPGRHGDLTGEPSGALFEEWFSVTAWVDAVEIESDDVAGCMIVLGDSITDGSHVPFGSGGRWTDVLTQRTMALPHADPRRRPVMSAGLDGNTLGSVGDDEIGPNGLARLTRDALDPAGSGHVMVFLGTNDISVGRTADDVESDLRAAVDAIRSAGRIALGATVLPRAGGVRWNSGKERQRLILNERIRGGDVFDGVADFDAALRDGSRPTMIRSELDADGTHPDAAGHAALASAFPLDLLRPR